MFDPRAALHRSRLGLRCQSGSSLVELSVVMLVLSIVMLAVIQGFSSFQRTAQSNDVRLQNLDEARVLMATTTKDLRTATRLTASTAPFLIAADREVRFYANIDTNQAPKLVHLYVTTANVLIEEATPADAGSVAPNYTYTGSAVVRFVGRFVANGTGEPLFTYYDATGAQLTSTPLSASDMLAVNSVGVTFAIRKQNAQNVPVTTVVNQVYLPNVYYNPIPTSSP
jgi:Tfp pilus assembly protein PilW